MVIQFEEMSARIWISSTVILLIIVASCQGVTQLPLRSLRTTARTKAPIWVSKLECPGQPYPVTKVHTCQLRNVRDRSYQEVNVVIEYLEPEPHVFVHFVLYVRHQRSRTTLYETTFNLCKLLEDAKTNQVTRLVLDMTMKNFPQIVQPCPYEGYFNVTGLVLGVDMVPAFTLPGRYTNEVRVFNKRNQTLMSWVVEFELR